MNNVCRVVKVEPADSSFMRQLPDQRSETLKVDFGLCLEHHLCHENIDNKIGKEEVVTKPIGENLKKKSVAIIEDQAETAISDSKFYKAQNTDVSCEILIPDCFYHYAVKSLDCSVRPIATNDSLDNDISLNSHIILNTDQSKNILIEESRLAKNSEASLHKNYVNELEQSMFIENRRPVWTLGMQSDKSAVEHASKNGHYPTHLLVDKDMSSYGDNERQKNLLWAISENHNANTLTFVNVGDSKVEDNVQLNNDRSKHVDQPPVRSKRELISFQTSINAGDSKVEDNVQLNNDRSKHVDQPSVRSKKEFVSCQPSVETGGSQVKDNVQLNNDQLKLVDQPPVRSKKKLVSFQTSAQAGISQVEDYTQLNNDQFEPLDQPSIRKENVVIPISKTTPSSQTDDNRLFITDKAKHDNEITMIVKEENKVFLTLNDAAKNRNEVNDNTLTEKNTLPIIGSSVLSNKIVGPKVDKSKRIMIDQASELPSTKNTIFNRKYDISDHFMSDAKDSRAEVKSEYNHIYFGPADTLKIEPAQGFNYVSTSQHNRNEQVNSTSIIQQMTENISYGKLVDGKYINVKLKPKYLGELSIKIEKTSKGCIAKIYVEDETVKDILSKNLDNLLDSFTNKMIKVDQVIFTSALKDSTNFNSLSQQFNNQNMTRQNFNQKDQRKKYGSLSVQGSRESEPVQETMRVNGANNHNVNIYV